MYCVNTREGTVGRTRRYACPECNLRRSTIELPVKKDRNKPFVTQIEAQARVRLAKYLEDLAAQIKSKGLLKLRRRKK